MQRDRVSPCLERERRPPASSEKRTLNTGPNGASCGVHAPQHRASALLMSETSFLDPVRPSARRPPPSVRDSAFDRRGGRVPPSPGAEGSIPRSVPRKTSASPPTKMSDAIAIAAQNVFRRGIQPKESARAPGSGGDFPARQLEWGGLVVPPQLGPRPRVRRKASEAGAPLGVAGNL